MYGTIKKEKECYMHAFNDNTDCYRYTHSPTLSAACDSEAIDWTEKQKVSGGGSMRWTEGKR